MEKILKLWMPLTKSVEGKFMGILSDDSLDRDDEAMDSDLLKQWSKTGVLPALANHENKMEKFVGGWKNLRVVEKDGNTALMAEPFFFSKEANPLAAQIKKQIEEAVENGLNPGISIGAIPQEHIEKTIDGENRRVYTKAELLEATFVPIQSNRNASFGHIAKKFDLENTDSTIQKEEDIMKKEAEEEKPAEVVPEAEPEATPEEPVVEEKAEEVAEEVEEEKPAEEPVEEEPAEEPAEEPEAEKDSSIELKKEVEKLKAEVKELKEKAVMAKAPTVESGEIEDAPTPTVESMLKARYGKK